jgi:hypothetical protein
MHDDSSKTKCLGEFIKELQNVNKQLAKLTLKKEELTDSIVSGLDHNHEGQRTYECGVWKVEVRTPFTYCLNKKLYETGSLILEENYNPIKESISYSIDKGLCEKYMVNAPKNVKHALAKLIDKKPGKASVVIKERI